jgi:aminoglycoside phosphotransferase (APT) family kinase protein
VAAVLDWELCTIGDPIADFVWSLAYWAEPGEQLFWLLDPLSKAMPRI